VEGSGCDVVWDTVPLLTWRDWGIKRKAPFRIASDSFAFYLYSIMEPEADSQSKNSTLSVEPEVLLPLPQDLRSYVLFLLRASHNQICAVTWKRYRSNKWILGGPPELGFSFMGKGMSRGTWRLVAGTFQLPSALFSGGSWKCQRSLMPLLGRVK
jgi:hypothetical protein